MASWFGDLKEAATAETDFTVSSLSDYKRRSISSATPGWSRSQKGKMADAFGQLFMRLLCRRSGKAFEVKTRL